MATTISACEDELTADITTLRKIKSNMELANKGVGVELLAAYIENVISDLNEAKTKMEKSK